MQITGTIRVRSTAGDTDLLERIDHEMTRVQALSDDAIEAMCTLIGARDPLDVVRKLYRFTIALASPEATLGRIFAHEPDALPGFCLNLIACRAYMDRLASGEIPGRAADAVESERRTWLARTLHQHDIAAPHLVPNSPRDEEEKEEDDAADD